uniref:Alpha-macroglobulin receptor-binding domain-containing protein n=1 Tax=Latimeria chalumnae TaxID=7897 RepID=H3A5F6_LATCH
GKVNFTATAEALQTDDPCGNEVVAVPEKGATDTVVKSVLVELEGVPQEKTHNSLLCPEGRNIHFKNKTKSARGKVDKGVRKRKKSYSNVISSAFFYLEGMLDMPAGCGEQTMAVFVTNAYGLQYLEATAQLTDNRKARSKVHLESVYQKILAHKNANGSYNAFTSYYDDKESIWLTAFVMKSFSEARRYIFIDEKLLTDAVQWLSSKQMENGCFPHEQLFNNLFEGESHNENFITAYVIAALLELKDSSVTHNDPVIKTGLSCLRNRFENETKVHNLALMFYTFTLAGDDNMREKLLEKLNRLAIKKGDLVHWDTHQDEDEDEISWGRFHGGSSATVEVTSYVLLALLSKPKVTSSDLKQAFPIVKWLIQQQGPFGGFRSSQDTAVAIHALAKYAEHTYDKDSVNTVKVKSDTRTEEFLVNNKNSLFPQKVHFPDNPTKYSIEAAGKGCVIVQVTHSYNVPHLKTQSGFYLSVETAPKECTETANNTFELKIKAGYTGKRLLSNMAIIEVKMTSGFVPVENSLRKLKQEPLVGRVETRNSQVIIYLEHITKEIQEYTLSVEQSYPVENLKPASVKVYDYYHGGEHAMTEYHAPCHTGKNKK